MGSEPKGCSLGSKFKIMVLNYGVNNLRSVMNAFNHVADESCEISVTDNPADLVHGNAFVLPGVGSFREGFEHFVKRGFDHALAQQVLERKKPVWAICLGMQFLMNSSEEGGFTKGLGWIPGKTIRFDLPIGFRVPHIGWNDIRVVKSNSFFQGTENESGFYFDHSYHVVVKDPKHVLATCDYGIDFACAVQRDNIVAMQFHPEKSHMNGLRAIKNYIQFAKEMQSHA